MGYGRKIPDDWFVRSYPKFRVRRLLRFLFDHFQSDVAFNLLLATRLMRFAAGVVYCHNGVFGPHEREPRSLGLPSQRDVPP